MSQATLAQERDSAAAYKVGRVAGQCCCLGLAVGAWTRAYLPHLLNELKDPKQQSFTLVAPQRERSNLACDAGRGTERAGPPASRADCRAGTGRRQQQGGRGVGRDGTQPQRRYGCRALMADLLGRGAARTATLGHLQRSTAVSRVQKTAGQGQPALRLPLLGAACAFESRPLGWRHVAARQV